MVASAYAEGEGGNRLPFQAKHEQAGNGDLEVLAPILEGSC